MLCIGIYAAGSEWRDSYIQVGRRFGSAWQIIKELDQEEEKKRKQAEKSKKTKAAQRKNTSNF